MRRGNKVKDGLLHQNYVTAVGCLQFRKRSIKRQTKITFERQYSLLHHWLLSLGYVMFQKSIFEYIELKGHKQPLRGARPPVATALAEWLTYFEQVTWATTRKGGQPSPKVKSKTVILSFARMRLNQRLKRNYLLMINCNALILNVY